MQLINLLYIYLFKIPQEASNSTEHFQEVKAWSTTTVGLILSVTSSGSCDPRTKNHRMTVTELPVDASDRPGSASIDRTGL